MRVSKRWVVLAGLAVTAAGWLPALAQEAASAPAAAVQKPLAGMSLQEIMSVGGSLMWVLAAMSVLALALVLYYAFILRQEKVVPRAHIDTIRHLLAEGRTDEARIASSRRPSPISAVTSAALDYAERVKQADPVLLKEIIEGEGSRQASLLQNQTQYLLDIAVIAPMVGLLGTVFGMVNAFSTVASDLAKATPMQLAGGVYQALFTTAFGLIVGIPAMAFHAYFRGRVSSLVSLLENAAADLLTLLVERVEKR
jgi:biopolymer transport protein ExbB